VFHEAFLCLSDDDIDLSSMEEFFWDLRNSSDLLRRVTDDLELWLSFCRFAVRYLNWSHFLGFTPICLSTLCCILLDCRWKVFADGLAEQGRLWIHISTFRLEGKAPKLRNTKVIKA